MPIRHAIWKVAPEPESLPETTLQNEQLLEDMIVATLTCPPIMFPVVKLGYGT